MLWSIGAGLEMDMEAKRFRGLRRPERDGKGLRYQVCNRKVTFEAPRERSKKGFIHRSDEIRVTGLRGDGILGYVMGHADETLTGQYAGHANTVFSCQSRLYVMIPNATFEH